MTVRELWYLGGIFLCLCFIVGLIYFCRKRMGVVKDLKIFRQRTVEIAYTAHFLDNIVASLFGKMLVEEMPKSLRAKKDIIQFLGYLSQVERIDLRASWAVELDQLNCFVRLLKDCYGDAAIQYVTPERIADAPDIPRGILFFPLENCLKHAHISAEKPIHFIVSDTAAGVRLSCSNHRKSIPVTDKEPTGFGLLDAKIKQADFEIKQESWQDGDQFFLILDLNWKIS